MVSLMNGLSALGTGVAQFAGTAGLEYQKAALANQSAILADQLATTRESAGRVQAGAIAATAATQAQAAQAANVATEQAGAGARNTATIAGTAADTAATQAGAMARTQADINKPTELEKTDRYLGINPDGTPKSSGAAPAASTTVTPSGNAPAATSADGSPAASSLSSSGAATTPSGAATPAGIDPNVQARRDKAMGLPALGSPEAIARAIALDVKADPAFKYKTAGQQAAETELRIAIAGGKMTDPASRETMARAIASYQVAPLASFALTKPGGPETMARAMEINPDYQESRYPEVNKAMSAFGTGKQGDIVRSLNVGVQHLDVIDDAARNLNNTDVGVINTIKNQLGQQFGSTAAPTFDGLKQIVATEVEKAVAGGIGSSGDRDRLMAALDRARSPAQLQAMTDGFRALMVGQLSGLKTQYEEATGFKGGPFAFESKLVPATISRLHGGGATPAPDAATPVAAASTAPAGPQTVYTDSGPVDLPGTSAPVGNLGLVRQPNGNVGTPSAPVVPSWVKPGDQYSPSRGMARSADGKAYGAPQ